MVDRLSRFLILNEVHVTFTILQCSQVTVPRIRDEMARYPQQFGCFAIPLNVEIELSTLAISAIVSPPNALLLLDRLVVSEKRH